MVYFLIKTAHVIGAAVLLGTGAGIAFFMLMAFVWIFMQFISPSWPPSMTEVPQGDGSSK